MKFYCTFGQSQKHIVHGNMMEVKNFYVIVWADSKNSAHQIMFIKFGGRWSMIYERHNFDKKLFPKGCLMQLGKKTDEDELDDKLEWIYEQRRYNREVEEGEGDSNNKLLPEK